MDLARLSNKYSNSQTTELPGQDNTEASEHMHATTEVLIEISFNFSALALARQKKEDQEKIPRF